MSFYGKVLYEFRKLFSHFKFENLNSSKVPTAAQVLEEPKMVEANDNWDTLKFKAGNRWLGMSVKDIDNDTTENNTEEEDTVILYHMGDYYYQKEYLH